MDINSLTLGEVAKVEEVAKASITSFNDPATPKARLMIGMAFVIKKRENPTVKLADIEAMTFDEVNALLGEGEPEGN